VLSNVVSELLLSANIVRFQLSHIKCCDIWTGQYCTFAKAKDTGDIYAWGLNDYCQLGKTILPYCKEVVWKSLWVRSLAFLRLDPYSPLTGVFRGWTLAHGTLLWYGMKKFFRCYITHKWKTCALTCQICGYFS